MAGRDVFLSSKAVKEVQQALTLPGFFGVPRYTTALLPPAPGEGAMAFDTTTSTLKFFDGSSWVEAGGGGALEPGTTTVTGAANAVLYADAGGVLRATASELGYDDTVETLFIRNIAGRDQAVSGQTVTITGGAGGIALGGSVSLIGGAGASTGGNVNLTTGSGATTGNILLDSGAGRILLVEAGSATAPAIGFSVNNGTGFSLDDPAYIISVDAAEVARFIDTEIAFRQGITTPINLYGTFTDASNYERLTLTHDGSGTAYVRAVSAGTGTDDQSLQLQATGPAGGVRLEADGVTHLEVSPAGIVLDRTITPGGTTGAQTINKIAGTVNFAAGATTLVVTNSLVTANSIIFAVRRTDDATCLIAGVEPAAGSFTIRMTVACTAETSVGFLVTN